MPWAAAAPLIGLGSSIFGGIMKGKEAKKQQELLAQQQQWLKDQRSADQGRYDSLISPAQGDTAASRQAAIGGWGDATNAWDTADSKWSGTEDAYRKHISDPGYGEGSEGMYYTPEEIDKIGLSDKTAQQIRNVSTAGVGGAYDAANFQLRNAAARRGNYAPGMNATIQNLARDRAKTQALSNMTNEINIWDRGSQAAKGIADQRTGTLRDILGTKLQDRQFGTSGLGSTAAGFSGVASGKSGVASGLSGIYGQDLSKLMGYEGLRNNSNQGYAGQITGVTGQQSQQPGPWFTALNTIGHGFDGGSGGFSWSNPLKRKKIAVPGVHDSSGNYLGE